MDWPVRFLKNPEAVPRPVLVSKFILIQARSGVLAEAKDDIGQP
jgi:hypothetical protein